jgi:hypothetical protein
MIVAREPVIVGEVTRRGWSVMRLADELGVSLPTAQAVTTGEPVGAKTIEAALRVFAPLKFEDLFEVVVDAEGVAETREPETQEAAA